MITLDYLQHFLYLKALIATKFLSTFTHFHTRATISITSTKSSFIEPFEIYIVFRKKLRNKRRNPPFALIINTRRKWILIKLLHSFTQLPFPTIHTKLIPTQILYHNIIIRTTYRTLPIPILKHAWLSAFLKIYHLPICSFLINKFHYIVHFPSAALIVY